MASKLKHNPRIAVIRTSDVISHKMCRRKWNWTSHLREGLTNKVTANPLWLGSAFHFGLEDVHGYNKYGTPTAALQAYAMAHKTAHPSKQPEDFWDLLRLGCDMMDYYSLWLRGRDPLETYMHDGIPQCEVNITVPMPWSAIEKECKKYSAERYARIREKYDEVVYSMQLDRVIKDEHSQLWIVEYKTAQAMQTQHYLTDPQVGTYFWGAYQVYSLPIAGIIYQQHKKASPNYPRELVNGTISTAMNQGTTHRMYRQALIKKYGKVKLAPRDNVLFLNKLAGAENEDFDAYVRRDRIQRNYRSMQTIANQIVQVACDMLDPALALYPNPTRMCAMMCSLMGPCVSMDDGSDWKSDLEMETELGPHPDERDYWRKYLPDPTTFKGIKMPNAKEPFSLDPEFVKEVEQPK